MYKMIANFHEAAEKKNGYIGKADLTIADAIKIHGISVFQKDNGGINIDFPGFEKNGEKRSYIVPKDKEAYAAMLKVVEGAVKDEKHHFGHVKGDMNPWLSVTGALVDEKYADGRFSLEVKDLCVLNGIKTRAVEHNDKKFTAVDMPTMAPYENEAGKKVYPKVFEGLKQESEIDGEKQTYNYADLIAGLVKHERKALKERKPSLDEQVQDANGVAEKENSAQQKEAPVQGMDR